MKPSTIEKEALHLPIEARAKLAQRLLSSLDSLTEKEAEQLWLKTAQQRADEIDSGEVKLVSADELEGRISSRLK